MRTAAEAGGSRTGKDRTGRDMQKRSEMTDEERM